MTVFARYFLVVLFDERQLYSVAVYRGTVHSSQTVNNVAGPPFAHLPSHTVDPYFFKRYLFVHETGDTERALVD